MERLSHLQYLKLLGNYLVCALKKCASLLRFTVSTAHVCQLPTLSMICLELQLQYVKCGENSFHLALTTARKIRWLQLCGSRSLLPKHMWSSFHSLYSCSFPAILLKLARTWLHCHHTFNYWTVYMPSQCYGWNLFTKDRFLACHCISTITASHLGGVNPGLHKYNWNQNQTCWSSLFCYFSYQDGCLQSSTGHTGPELPGLPGFIP